MFRQSQSQVISNFVSNYEHPLTSAQRKLDDLVERIEVCKLALQTTSLSGEQSLMARHLVSSLDQGVDELATQICSRTDSVDVAGASFTEQIERLLTICKQLSAAVLSHSYCHLA